jgi:hypothetical protein
MHLANAVGTPTLAIFINSDPNKFGPKGNKDKIINKTDGKIELNEVLEEACCMVKKLSSRVAEPSGLDGIRMPTSGMNPDAAKKM